MEMQYNRTMEHMLRFFVWFVILSLCGPVQGQDMLKKQLDDILEGYSAKNQFSGTVLVAKKGKVLYENAFGMADWEQGVSNKVDTKFLIGSATKSFTAIAVMQACEDGLLEVHKPLSAYLPELNQELGKLTLHFLMKNSSGLPVHLNRITELEHRDISSQELIALYNSVPLSFTPGTRFEYSNLNYQLAALVLERVTKTPYKDYLEKHIFKPLHMSHTGVERTGSKSMNKALGHDMVSGKFIRADENYMAYAKGGGDMYSTVKDLFKWDRALYSNVLVDANSKQQLFDGAPDTFGGYGYGFKVKPYDRNEGKESQGKLVRHGGSMYGYICNIHRYLDDEVLIVVLGNIRPYPTMEITVAIEDVLQSKGFF
tara:strand:- start:11657 stop:12766 length:1110 start_codon:yes stop_codon:yes gene_type:complete